MEAARNNDPCIREKTDISLQGKKYIEDIFNTQYLQAQYSTNDLLMNPIIDNQTILNNNSIIAGTLAVLKSQNGDLAWMNEKDVKLGYLLFSNNWFNFKYNTTLRNKEGVFIDPLNKEQNSSGMKIYVQGKDIWLSDLGNLSTGYVGARLGYNLEQIKEITNKATIGFITPGESDQNDDIPFYKAGFLLAQKNPIQFNDIIEALSTVYQSNGIYNNRVGWHTTSYNYCKPFDENRQRDVNEASRTLIQLP